MGGAVGFHFFALLLPANDDIASVPANIDDGVKVARGGVVEVACIDELRIDELTVFLLDVISIVTSTHSSSGSRR
jgi:hypothetical protein